MPDSDLLSRLKQARFVRVLAVYLGASWLVLQLVDVLMGMLPLPEWVGPVSVVLLLVGLVVVTATAWVQALPSTQAAEDAGEVPRDWEVAPADVLASLKSGKLPHLTWARAIMGGVMAMSLLFGFSGLYVLTTGGSSPFGAEPAGASVASTGLAVLPFDVTGSDADLLREGIVDLLSKGLDGTGDLRAIDSRTVLSRWDRMVGDEGNPELDQALRVAGATGARYAVWGSAVATGSQVRLSGDIYDLDSGEKIGQASVEGSQDEILGLVDYLAVEVRRALLEGQDEVDLAVGRVENITTHSLPALGAYLEGAAYYRRADFPRAAEAFQRAVAEDSTFALAYYRLSASYGSMEISGTPEADQAERMLDLLESELPARARRLLEGGRLWGVGDPNALAYLRQTVDLYPDDPEAWFNLGEYYFHDGPMELLELGDMEEVWLRALDLDPGFAPTYIHLIQVQLALGDGTAAGANLDRYVALAPADSHQADALRMAYDLQFGSPEAHSAARSRVASASDHVAGDTWLGLTGGPRTDPEREWVASARGWFDARAMAQLSGGRIGDAVETVLAASDESVPHRVRVMYSIRTLVGPVDPRMDAFLQENATLDACQGVRGSECLFIMGSYAADRGEIDVAEEAARLLRERGSELAQDPGTAWVAPAFAVSATALDGYLAWRTGDLAEAISVLQRTQGRAAPGSGHRDELVRIWLGQLLLSEGRTDAAVPYLTSLHFSPQRWYADYRLVEAYRTGGHFQEATEVGQRFLTAWAGADPARPEVSEVEEALAHMGG